MFKINAAPTFSCRVMLSIAGSDTPVPVSVTFRHLTARAYSAWHARLGAGSVAESLHEIVAGWGEGFVDDDGKPVPYTAEALALLLDQHPSAGVELHDAYVRQLFHARAKN